MVRLELLEPVSQVLVPVWMARYPVSLGQGWPVQAPGCLAAMLSLLAALRVRWPVCLIPS